MRQDCECPLGEIEEEDLKAARAARRMAALPSRARPSVRDYLMQAPAPVTPETVARNFVRAPVPEVTAILETFTALGQASRDTGSYWA